MTTTTWKFYSALCATAMDVVVLSRFGPLLWKTWAPNGGLRIALLLLAGALTFTLMDIWSQIAEEPLPCVLEPDNHECSFSAAPVAGGNGGADV